MSTSPSQTQTTPGETGVRHTAALKSQRLPGDSLHLLIEGRVDRRTPGGTGLVWQGTRVSLEFTGSLLALHFEDGVDQAHFDLRVDDQVERISLRNGAPLRFTWPRPLSAGKHRMTLFKRSEAAAGHVRLAAIEVEQGAETGAPAPAGLTPRLLFIGDSITVGACNEDGPEDQWEDRATHNNARSYGALTASSLAADYRCIAVSGMGVCEGYVPVLAHQVWNRLYPELEAPLAAHEAGWEPDIILVNLGENDSSFTRNAGRPFPPAYEDRLVSLVADIRAAHPNARLVLLRGGMAGGARNPDLIRAWEAAVRRIEKADTNFAHYAFAHWAELHPRVSDDEAMARELGAWLLSRPWFRPRG